ncbi:hypothetical protein BTJ39_23820 [Izhakiella australiensis]|uniref:Uncharacterized protein n=1 Tax=Izhakiella australiensis TaxID=1926881 RepID=A0A1S8Y725_9GAMM|nr:hypothetical protein [Izhakiella australiensis]OON34647.1 hypothetical protein BTJ39_23820 [Izhakiella australiensis]
MSIDATIKAKRINEISPYGDGYNRRIEIDVEDLEIAEAVKADEIVSEYDVDDLLDAIGESDVINWLEGNGYTVEKD